MKQERTTLNEPKSRKGGEYNVEPFDKARKLKRMSFTDLAARIGLGEAMVRAIFSGRRNPTEKTVFAMSEILEVPMSEVLVDEGIVRKSGRRTA